jgi:hypothetical protein
MGEKQYAFSILMRKPEEMRPLERTRRTWDGNIKMDLKGIEWEIVDWIHLAWQRNQCHAVMNTVMNLQIP